MGSTRNLADSTSLPGIIDAQLAARGLLPSLYTGFVATAGLVPHNQNTGSQQQMAVTNHWARDDLSSIQLVYPGFWMNMGTGVEAVTSANTTIEASIEYPIGTYTRVTFSSANQGVITDGGMITSDAVTVAIPRGANFRVRTWFSNSAGIIYCSYPNGGNLLSFGTTTPNYVMGGGNPAAQGGAAYGPIAIIGQTRRSSFALVGDSRVVGLGDTADINCNRGSFARMIGSAAAYANLGVGGDRAGWFVSSHANRLALCAYASHILCNYGINDIYGASGTSATVRASLTTIFGYTNIAGKPIWQATLEPIGVTGPYTSDANQTAHATNTNRVTFNSDILSGSLAGLRAVIDINALLESSTKTGVWRTDSGAPLTADGAHANKLGNIFTAQLGRGIDFAR